MWKSFLRGHNPIGFSAPFKAAGPAVLHLMRRPGL
jgi:hypothetical protein